MAQTTTHVNACDVGVWLDDINGTARDISGSSNAASLTFSQNIGEMPTFGTDWPRRLACGRDATCKLTVIYSTAANEGKDILVDWFFGSDHSSARTMSIYIPDKNVGSDMYSGNWVLESLDIPVQAGDGKPIAVSASLSCDGEITLSTAST